MLKFAIITGIVLFLAGCTGTVGDKVPSKPEPIDRSIAPDAHGPTPTTPTHAEGRDESASSLDENDRVSELVQGGIGLLLAGDYPTAIVAFESAMRITPEAETQHLIGEAYMRLGAERRAQEAFNKALSLNPGFTPSLNELGLIHYRARSYDVAMRYFERSLQIDSEQAEVWFQAGRAAWHMNNNELAIQLFENTIAINHEAPGAWFALTALYAFQNDTSKSMEALEMLRQQSPEMAEQLYEQLMRN